MKSKMAAKLNGYRHKRNRISAIGILWRTPGKTWESALRWAARENCQKERLNKKMEVIDGWKWGGIWPTPDVGAIRKDPVRIYYTRTARQNKKPTGRIKEWEATTFSRRVHSE